MNVRRIILDIESLDIVSDDIISLNESVKELIFAMSLNDNERTIALNHKGSFFYELGGCLIIHRRIKDTKVIINGKIK